jgi:hypothetical protein
MLGFTISGQVEKFVTVIPKTVNLNGPADAPLRVTVKIIPEEKYPFRIIETKAKFGKDIHYNLQVVKRSPLIKYLLTIENKKKEKGRYYDVVYLKTDSKLKPQINVNVYGRIGAPKGQGNN